MSKFENIRKKLCEQSDDFQECILANAETTNFYEVLDQLHSDFFERVWEALNSAQKIEIAYSEFKKSNKKRGKK